MGADRAQGGRRVVRHGVRAVHRAGHPGARRGGKAFVSYGTTVPGLQGLDWRTFGQLDLDKIAATAQ